MKGKSFTAKQTAARPWLPSRNDRREIYSREETIWSSRHVERRIGKAAALHCGNVIVCVTIFSRQPARMQKLGMALSVSSCLANSWCATPAPVTHAHVRTRVQTVAEANRCPGLDEIKPSIYEGGRGGGYYDDGGGGGGGGGGDRGGGKAWRRERRKEGCPSPRWQPSASRVQGHIINLFQRFLHSQKTKGIGGSNVLKNANSVLWLRYNRNDKRATATVPFLPKRHPDDASYRDDAMMQNGTFFFMQDYDNKEKKDDFEIFKVMKNNALIDFAAAKNFLTNFETKYLPLLLNMTNGYNCTCNSKDLGISLGRHACRVSEGTLPVRLSVLQNDRMNQIWRYINAPNYAACRVGKKTIRDK
ncbi:hypothetical protein G5I_09103 [Acromyrmex echinatior]|uniref:Uncharacterized protein n=1 Tax=Acromyrmex echinatior TaxID=103372 RepID=F4WTE5_ACREC|nr:hypothetical protein G5I_09103 [Acromyrmex echinatior]